MSDPALAKMIALGKRTGHAPATCSECGFVAMLSVVTSSGTRRGLKSTPWPKCKLCGSGLMIIADADFEGVARVKFRTK